MLHLFTKLYITGILSEQIWLFGKMETVIGTCQCEYGTSIFLSEIRTYDLADEEAFCDQTYRRS